MVAEVARINPIEAATLVIAWHAKSLADGGMKTDMAARGAIDLHTVLRDLDDSGNRADIGMWHLLASLIDYAEAHDIPFDTLVMDAEANNAIHGSPSKAADDLTEEKNAPGLQAWHLMRSLVGFAKSNEVDFDELVRDVRAEVAADPSSPQRLAP